MKKAKDSPHRLKQKDLVATLFVLFSEEYDRSEVNSIADIEFSMADIRDYLEKKVGIAYSSDTWITTQIHKYEEEIGTTLFRKATSPRGPTLGLCKDLQNYEQKRHLYVTQKIRTANGAFDLIRNSLADSFSLPPISLLLGAGSTVTRVAEIIAQNLLGSGLEWEISTHNLGVIECLGKTGPGFDKVKIFVPEGRFDPATNLILGENLALCLKKRFDWVVQGTSYLSGGALYVERSDETEVKRGLLRRCGGKKVLLLTGHEASAKPPAGIEPFGLIDDFDYIVHPALPPDSAAALRLSRELSPAGEPPRVMIRNWSYEILRPAMARARDGQGRISGEVRAGERAAEERLS